jgi:hypothetical protein
LESNNFGKTKVKSIFVKKLTFRPHFKHFTKEELRIWNVGPYAPSMKKSYKERSEDVSKITFHLSEFDPHYVQVRGIASRFKSSKTHTVTLRIPLNPESYEGDDDGDHFDIYAHCTCYVGTRTFCGCGHSSFALSMITEDVPPHIPKHFSPSSKDKAQFIQNLQPFSQELRRKEAMNVMDSESQHNFPKGSQVTGNFMF